MPQIEIIQASAEADIDAVRQIFLEYLDYIENFLGQNLSFQGTEAEFQTFPGVYDALYLAKLDGAPAAACAIKPFSGGICELKRLYSRPFARGHNVGEALTRTAISGARQLGYQQIYLDTDPGLPHANAIYERLGFTDIEKYYDNPIDGSRYMALTLTDEA